LTYQVAGLHASLDLGKWWHEHTGGLPLPLGHNAVRRALGTPMMARIARVLRRSIQEGLAHRQEALEHSLQWARGLDIPVADRFVGMYVNDLTLDLGDRGRQGLRRFLDEAHQQGILPKRATIEFVDYDIS
jgi:1,4-dihydroxy-6-naphthoate synthase